MVGKSIAALLALVLVAWLIWRWQQPVYYQLQVVNNSPAPVDQVRLFGRGVVEEDALFSLLPGTTAMLTIELADSGDLRFEVAQGLNRIDTFIVRDIDQLTQRQQRLEINANNRFIIAP